MIDFRRLESDLDAIMGTQDGLPPIVDGAYFTASKMPEPDTLITGLVHRGTKTVIGGGSKSFKTWVQLDAAVCVAYGQSWLGYECIPGRVLFINLEIQPAFFQSRLMRVCEARGIQQSPERLDVWNLRGYSAPYQTIIPKVIARIKRFNYSLVILDPIYKLYGDTDENSAGEVAQMLNELERICVETGSSVLFGAHYSKGNQSAKESIDRISGSGVFARDPDTILPFTRHENDGSFVVEPILRNLEPQDPFVVTWQFPLMVRDDQLDPASLKQVNGQGRKKDHNPVEFLNAIQHTNESKPVSISEWSRLAKIPRTTLMQYVSQLRTAGMISTIGAGANAKQFITNKGLEAL